MYVDFKLHDERYLHTLPLTLTPSLTTAHFQKLFVPKFFVCQLLSNFSISYFYRNRSPIAIAPEGNTLSLRYKYLVNMLLFDVYEATGNDTVLVIVVKLKYLNSVQCKYVD